MHSAYKYILVIVKEETEKYLEKCLTDVAFNQSPHIKTILQDGKIVKINEVHQKLFGHTLEDIKDVTIDDLNQKYPVLFNDTGLALSFKQIYNLVLSNQYPHIFYRSFLYIPSYEDYLGAIARNIDFNGRPAVEYTIFKKTATFKNKFWETDKISQL